MDVDYPAPDGFTWVEIPGQTGPWLMASVVANEIKRLRRALDCVKVRSYELNVSEIHDMALAALNGERQ